MQTREESEQVSLMYFVNLSGLRSQTVFGMWAGFSITFLANEVRVSILYARQRLYNEFSE